MAKGLNKIQVGLTFTADTGNAKAQLKDLKRQIDNLQSATVTGTGITPLNKELTEALNASSRLKVALEQATNVDTGRLDLSKFSLQLKQSGMTMKDFSKHLTNLGPDGEKAFLQLAQSIVTAEVPMKRANAALEEMWTTMKNTARWQISSSVLHGFMGAVQSAYGYAQDLNESLNDIRIVTGYNTDQMAKFAKEANKAAKALSTTTTEYTNASLIYFQQGLNDQQVKERTDITVKMANVSKQSAETVSDQMTAVWNNFYDGSKSLEYYADVMTKLGAATASSSDEIAQGLEKFAAIADTVGLSYDYAASALATVTAETRQSADVVGTAFKTIFARIEGLSLGETLEDGTDLNKYSAALATVGVNIKDTNGEMKQMDQILEDLGARWQTLGQDQKIALAQTVAGVRQYNQLIALMDNWDTFQENLNTAQGSEGALAAQAAIYAESWEAAQDRVTAAAEDIYSKLLNDEFFIDLTNMLADVIDGFSKLIDSMGGLPGLLTMIGGIAVRVFKNQIGESIDRMVYNLKVSTGLVKKETDKMRDETLKALTSFGGQSGYESKNLEVEFMKQQITLAYDLKEISDKISKQDQEHIKNLIGINGELQKSVVSTMELKEAQEEKVESLKKEFKERAVRNVVDSTDYNKASTKERDDMIAQTIGAASWAEDAGRMDANLSAITSKEFSVDMLGDITKTGENNYASSIFQEIQENGESVYGFTKTDILDLEKRVQALAPIIEQIKTLDEELDKLEVNSEEYKENRKKRDEQVAIGKTKVENYKDSTIASRRRDKKVAQTFSQKTENFDDKTKEKLLEIKKGATEATKAQRKLDNQQKSLAKSTKNLNNAFKNAAKATKSFGEKIVNAAQGVSGIVMGVSSIKGAIDALTDTDLSPLERLQGFLMSMGMAIPSITDGLSKLGGGFSNLSKAMSYSTQYGEKFGAILNAENSILKDQDETTKKLLTQKFLTLQVDEELNEETSKLVAQNLLKNVLTDEMNEEDRESLINKTALLLLEKQKNQEEIKGIGALLMKGPLMKLSDKIEQTTIGTKVLDIAATLGLSAATQSLIWPITLLVAVLAILLAGLVVLAVVAVNAAKAFGENAKATLEQEKANQELIDSNQELADSVENLIDEYNALKESGESTYDTMEKLKEQVPELIESYRELEDSLAIDLNTGLMEAAARMAEITGNWDEFNRLMDEANEKVEEAEKDSYEAGSVSAGQLMADAGRKGSGNVKGTTYSNELGGWGSDEKEANEALQEALKEKGIAFDKNGNASTKVELDTTDPTQMVNYYEALSAAKAKLEKEGDTESDTYREISEELNEMAEAYQEAKVQADEYLKLLAKDFDKNFNSLAEENEIFATASTSFANYEANLDGMATKLAKLEGITEEEAKAIIKASDAFKDFAALDDSMDKIIADTGATKEAIGDVYDSLSDEDKTLFLTLDFTEIDKNNLANSIQAALEEAREKAMVAQSKAEAKELGLDESAFEAYTELLQDANDHLKDNAGMASKVALSNARLSKGLVTLTDSFKDHVAVLAEGNRQSYEYAEAIGALKDSFEEMFGYKPSSVFIENHLEEIQKLANGDIEALQELRDGLAKDYVLTMEVGTAINTEFGEGMSTDDVRNELIEMLESIDTSVEVGAGTTISEDYLNSMQAMLDQGQITEEQLTKMLRTKGIEMKVTGHKQVPGPKTTTIQTITSWPGIKRTKTIEEQQMISVPIINGDDSNIYGTEPSGQVTVKTSDGEAVKEPTIDKSKVAQFAKGPDESSISTAAFEDATGKKETEKKIKELEDEKDIYHDTQRELQRLERQYNKINEAKERAYGKQKLAYMEQENEIREAEIAQMEIEIQKANALAETLKNQGAQTYGLSFYNNSGEIANYDEIYEREKSYYIKALQSGNEEAIAAAEERWENFKELVSEYEEALDKTAESEEQIAAKQAEIYDTYLEGLEYELEIKLEIDDSKLKILEYQLSKIEDNAFEAATKIDLLGQSTETLLSKGQNYQDSINNLFNKHGLTVEQASGMTDEQLLEKGFTAQELESLRSWQDGLLEVNQALLENKKAVEESVMPAYEAWGEEFDKLTEQVEYATSVLNHYQNVIDLVGRKRLGFDDEFMTSLSRGALSTANDNLTVAKERLAFAEASAAEADDKLEAAKARLAQDPKNEQLQRDVEYWEKIKNELNSDVRTQSQAVQDATTAALDAAKQSYMVATDAIIEQFNKGLSATGESMDKMMEKYSHTEEKDDWYLEGYEKMYELNKLSRELDTKLSKATSLQEQESLRKLLEEVNAKKAEGVEMSEHDLAVLKGQVEMEQARLAVEEAREAKTQVIRRRDSEGNYGYIYTADEEASADALQNYEDKVYELMDLNDEYLDDLGMKILEARQMMGEEIAALREEDFASQAEYEAAVQAIKDKYTEQINYYTDEMNKALGYNKDIYSQDIINRLAWKGESVQVTQDQLLAMAAIRQEDYANMEDYFAAVAEATGLSVETVKALYHDGTLAQIEEVSAQIGAHEDLQTSFDDTVLSQTTGFTTMQEFNTALTTSTETMVKDLGIAFKTYDEDIQMIIGDYDEFRDTVKTDVSGEGGVVEQSKLAAGSVADLKKSAEDNFKKATTAVDNWQSNYSTKIDAAIKSNDAYIISLGEVIAKIAEAEGAKSSYENGGTSGGGSGTGGNDGSISNKDGEIDPENANNSKTGGKTPIYGTYYKSDGTKVRFGGKDVYKDYRGLVNNGNKITAPGTYGSGASAVKVVKDDVVGDLLVESKAYPGNYLRLNDFIITGTTAAIGLGSFYHEPQDQIIGYKTSSYDTGGYTGEWGPEGRLALLHQKEIVLNARDTENMLAMTQMVREIAKQIDLTAVPMNRSIAPTAIASTNDGIEQNITIHAEFPDAVNQKEIEEAFNNLFIRVSQYANRKD